MRRRSIFFIFVFVGFSSFATHMRCGEVIVKQSAAGSTTVVITVVVFTNTVNTDVLFGGDDDWLYFGDGTRIQVPEMDNIPRVDLSPDGSVASASFSVTHTYPALGSYIVSYSEPNRNAGVVNYDGSVNTRFYLETKFILLTDKAYQTPVALLPPIFLGFINDDFSASVAARDSNNFALYYSLEDPLMDKNTPVKNYRLPNSVELNPTTGLLTWDCKLNGENIAGEFLFALKVRQYDTAEDPWKEVGYVYRDFQVIVVDSERTRGRIQDNRAPGEEVINVPENSSRSLKIFAYPANGEVAEFSMAADLTDDFYSFQSYDSLHEAEPIMVGKVVITNSPEVTRDLPYVFSVRVSFTDADQRYYKDLSYAVMTGEFVPNFPPLVTGIEDEIGEFHLAPNPFDDYVQASHVYDMPITLSIFSPIGQLIATIVEDGQQIFSIPPLPSGLYLMRCAIGANKIWTSRMIKR